MKTEGVGRRPTTQLDERKADKLHLVLHMKTFPSLDYGRGRQHVGKNGEVICATY